MGQPAVRHDDAGRGEVEAAQSSLCALTDALRSLRLTIASVGDGDLAPLAAEAARISRLARGLLVTCTAEAEARGVRLGSGAPGCAQWLLDLDAGLTTTEAYAVRRALEVTADPSVTELRAAVMSGEATAADAVMAARIHDELRGTTDPQLHAGIASEVATLARQPDGRDQLRAYATATRLRHTAPVDEDRRRRHQETRRGLSAFVREADGMWSLHGLLSDADKAVLGAAVDALSAPDHAQGRHGETLPDERTPAQRRLDALVALAREAASRSRTGPMGATTRVSLVLPLGALRTPSAGLHRTDGDAPAAGPPDGEAGTSLALGHDGSGMLLSPTDARELSCAAEVTPVWVDERGTPVDVGRTTRLATARQRQLLEVRDGGCTFPGCGAPASWCQAHHLVHWADGGATDVDNLALLCGHHHRFTHHHGVRGTVTDGRVTWQVRRTRWGWTAAEDPDPPPRPSTSEQDAA
ncbi:DUF222 domain-containing protein [Arsenicicoccus dermatophilus]|uniref:HNH endonuclease signature motif containing protein n=1 Tax=Arsenicicoccus dermatophilus TaxID=1076331 RepID=UPI003916CCFB